MNAIDVTGPCAAVQYRLIMLMCGSRRWNSDTTEKPIGRKAELRTVRLLWNRTVRQFFCRPLVIMWWSQPHFTEPLDMLYDPLGCVVHFFLRCEASNAEPTSTVLHCHKLRLKSWLQL